MSMCQAFFHLLQYTVHSIPVSVYAATSSLSRYCSPVTRWVKCERWERRDVKEDGNLSAQIFLLVVIRPLLSWKVATFCLNQWIGLSTVTLLASQLFIFLFACHMLRWRCMWRRVSEGDGLYAKPFATATRKLPYITLTEFMTYFYECVSVMDRPFSPASSIATPTI